MITEFVKRFDAARDALRAQFAAAHPESYEAIVRAVIEVVRDADDEYDSPDPARIHVIDDGDYQGTLLFVIAAGGYQPSDYWYVKVGYGSCSGCDTLEAIRNYDDEPPTAEQAEQYLTLALHIVQGLKKMGDEEGR
jgi:hypothetical protein